MIPTRQQLIDAFADAIAWEEGFYAKGLKPNKPQRNNSPGDLRPWTGCLYKRDSDNFVIFPNPEEGWLWLKRQCDRNIFIRFLTFQEFFQGKFGVYAGYAPASDGNKPNLYAQHVMARVSDKLNLSGLTLSTVISTIADQPIRTTS